MRQGFDKELSAGSMHHRQMHSFWRIKASLANFAQLQE
jgi:hypothetical protein